MKYFRIFKNMHRSFVENKQVSFLFQIMVSTSVRNGQFFYLIFRHIIIVLTILNFSRLFLKQLGTFQKAKQLYNHYQHVYFKHCDLYISYWLCYVRIVLSISNLPRLFLQQLGTFQKAKQLYDHYQNVNMSILIDLAIH